MTASDTGQAELGLLRAAFADYTALLQEEFHETARARLVDLNTQLQSRGVHGYARTSAHAALQRLSLLSRLLEYGRDDALHNSASIQLVIPCPRGWRVLLPPQHLLRLCFFTLRSAAALALLQRHAGAIDVPSMTTDVFSAFYRFSYFVCREQGKRNVLALTAVGAWRLVLAGRFRLLEPWCNFISGHTRTTVVLEDTWRQVPPLQPTWRRHHHRRMCRRRFLTAPLIPLCASNDRRCSHHNATATTLLLLLLLSPGLGLCPHGARRPEQL